MSNAADVDLQPTAERMRRMMGSPERVERPKVDQKTNRKAWRMKPIIESLLADEHIRAPAHDAFVCFERDWDIGMRDPQSHIAKYGKAAAQGTPIGQMIAEAMERAEYRDVRRRNAHDRAMAALDVVRGRACRQALIMLVSEDTDLASIGTACSMFRNASQARAAAITLIQQATYDLQLHYDPGERKHRT